MGAGREGCGRTEGEEKEVVWWAQVGRVVGAIWEQRKRGRSVGAGQYNDCHAPVGPASLDGLTGTC